MLYALQLNNEVSHTRKLAFSLAGNLQGFFNREEAAMGSKETYPCGIGISRRQE